jgi:hypothetical protein
MTMLKDLELEKTIDGLPPIARKELADFVDYLQYKHQLDQSGQSVKLSGMWADIEFDVSDEDIRSLRRQVTGRLLDKV